MRLTSSRAYNRLQPVPKMPRGLVELMDGLARDVLMHNPTNVYEFCANHMEKLLEIRDGPSSKKSLTLDQKILKAQEKMRQKAQERRERYDRDINLESNDTTKNPNVKDTPLLSEDLVVPGPSLRVPIHHVVDLKNESEVEISHVPQVEKASLELRVTDNLNIDKTNPTKQESQKNLTDNLMEAENKITEIKLDEQQGQEIETKCINILDDDEPIFGKVENEVINVVRLKEPHLEVIGGIAAIDSPLQTITETSEENIVNDSAIILPKITIGEDGLDPDNIIDESQPETQLDMESKVNNENLAEFSTTNTSEIINTTNDVLDKDTENERIIPEVTPEQEKIMPDFVKKNEIEYVDNTLGNKLKKKDDGEVINEITQISNSPDADTADVNPDSNVEQTASSGCSSKVPADVTLNTDIPNLETPLAFVPDFIDTQDGDSANDPAYIDITEDKQTSAKDLIENSNVSEKEDAHDPEENEDNLIAKTDFEQISTDIVHLKTDTDDEHANMTTENESNLEAGTYDEHLNVIETTYVDVNVDPNKSIDTVIIEAEIAVTADKENLGNDVEQHDDSTEIPLQKSDSAGNTNDDSISMIESDLSKTDDDSTQNNSNMDLETAAVTIQKVFRSLMFKSRNSTFEDTTNDEHNSVDEDNDQKEEYYAAANLNKERRPLGITRMDTVLQTVNEEKSLSLSTDDSSTLSSAATTIQAHVRGFLVRNRLNSSKTFSINSLVNSHEVLEADPEQHKNKTILNIHIVPEEGNYLSRDESLITSMDLSLDGSPPSSVNLHPLSCDISERRKMLKREDAVQSVSPPSNNSGKLSEDSVKEVLINENYILERAQTDDKAVEIDDPSKELDNEASDVLSTASTVTPTTVITISKSEDPIRSPVDNNEATLRRSGRSLTKLSSDESDVITPFVPSPRSSEDGPKLVHSGEFHDVVLPTKVSRNDTSAVRGE